MTERKASEAKIPDFGVKNVSRAGRRAAAKSMKLAYRNAWLWVEAMNRLSPRPLVEKSTGGAQGGYARLTEEGRRIVRDYKEKRARVRDILE